MIKRHNTVQALAVITCFFSASSLATTVTAYTDQAAFLAALTSPANTLDFDSLTPGTLIADGETVNGITFNYNFGGVSMAVTDGDQYGGGGPFETTSGSQFLGTNDADIFIDGDDFTISFAPTQAIGLSFISADDMFDNDITLTAAGVSVELSVADRGTGLGFGSYPYFLGIIDDTSSFNMASIATLGSDAFLYNVDDITVSAVPLPAAVWLFGAALLGLGFMRKKTIKLD